PIPEYLDRGISVSLGSDGAPCNNNMNIFNEMRLAALIQKPLYGPTAMNAETVFRMATIDGARALGLEMEIVSIEPGKKADLAFCKIDEIHSIPFENIYSKVVYSSNSKDIRHLMIEGEWIVHDNRLVRDDVDRVILNANQALKHL
ncbi:MAG: N-ethylammeline chlorohydrolase, partial [Calditrichales bacterium]